MLYGNLGDDTLHGNLGADAFVFTSNGGNDVVADFVGGTDTIQIASNINGLSISSSSDLLTLISSDSGGNAVITLGSQTITLTGITEANLKANISTWVQII